MSAAPSSRPFLSRRGFCLCCLGTAAWPALTASGAAAADAAGTPGRPKAVGKAGAGGGTLRAAADHHLHIQGPDISAELGRMRARSPELFARIDPGIFDPHGAPDALAALDEAGVRQGVLLSQAYTFGSPLATTAPADVAALARRENAFVVGEGLTAPRRLAAFIGVNPLTEAALPEIAHWKGRRGVAGVKLHLGNARIDPGRDEDLARVGAVFAAARAADLAIAVHARDATPYTPDHVRRLIEIALPQAGDAPVQLAHGGGGGGLDAPTLAALELYADACAAGAPGTRNLIVDLAVVAVSDKTDPDLARGFVATARRMGLQRFVVGSDWPTAPSVDGHNRLMATQLPFTPEEWARIFANRAPYLSRL